MLSSKPLVSIIIPTYNEGEDVRLALDAAIGFNYEPKEIIVVDDSTDETVRIIREYERRGVRLIRRPSRTNGCCGARNLGISEAKGEIVILLNADVFPESDFINRILEHYKKGADYVLVWQKAANCQHLFPRFIQAQTDASYKEKEWKEWTEAFSCRKEAAVNVGLIPGDFPLPFCRDWLLGQRLGERYKKAIDETIIVSHTAPQRLGDFWRVRKNRGRFSFLFSFFIGTVSMRKLWFKRESLAKAVRKRPLWFLAARVVFKTTLVIGEIILGVPILWRCFMISRYSPRGLADIIPFCWACAIQDIAFVSGEGAAFFEVLRCKKDGFL
jgi:glycosyltransferase involved in cell wall biosynthesis